MLGLTLSTNGSARSTLLRCAEPMYRQRKQNGAENAALAAYNAANPGATYPLANASDVLNDLNVSASYIYDRTYSFSAGYLRTRGATDLGLYS